MMGQCLQKGSTVGHINIAALSAGTYLLQLNQGEASSAFSFVKSE
jgi:hypothetical protein